MKIRYPWLGGMMLLASTSMAQTVDNLVEFQTRELISADVMNSQFSKVKTAVDAHNDTLGEHTTDIAGHTSSLMTLNEDMDAVQMQLMQMQEALNQRDETINDLSAQVMAMSMRLNAVDAEDGGALGAIDTRFSGVEERLDAIDGEADPADEQNGALAALEERVEALDGDEGQVNDIDERLTGVIDDVALLNGGQADLIGQINSRLDALDGADGDVERLDGLVSSLSEQTQAHGGRLDGLDGPDGTIAAITNRLNGVDNSITAAVEVSNGFAERLNAIDGANGSVALANSRIDAIVGENGQIATINGRIDGAEAANNAQDGRLNSIDGQIATISDDISGINGNIAGLGTRAGNIEASITAVDDAFTAFQSLLNIETRDTIIVTPQPGEGEYARLDQAITALADRFIPAGQRVTIQLQQGVYIHDGPVIVDHPQASQIDIIGNEESPGLVQLLFGGQGRGGIVLTESMPESVIAGMTIEYIGEGQGSAAIELGNGVSVQALRNLIIRDFNGAAEGTNRGIYISLEASAFVSDVTIENCGDGVHVNGGFAEVINTSVVNSEDFRAAGYRAVNSGTIRVTDSTSEEGFYGVLAQNGSYARVINVSSSGTEYYGMSASGSSGLNCTTCVVESDARAGFYVSSGSYLGVGGNSSASGGDHGYRATYASRMLVSAGSSADGHTTDCFVADRGATITVPAGNLNIGNCPNQFRAIFEGSIVEIPN
ncbi:MAG: right-handed parallel beta-helix repeat-containing protein [Bradymonadia bacterium]